MPAYRNETTKKYYVSFYYTDWQGNRKKKKKEGFATKRDAAAYERDFLNRLAGDCSMQFDSLCENYLEDFKIRHKLGTYINKENSIKKHFIPAFGKMQLTDIKPVTIRNWQNKLLKTGYSDSFKNDLCAKLSGIFTFAVKYYGLSANPVKLAGGIGVKNRRDVTFWTIDEFNQFIKELETGKYYKFVKAPRSAVILAFKILFYTGLRIGELLALTVKDYDPQAQTLRINKTLSIIHRNIVVTTPKTISSNRVVTLPEKICKILDEHINNMYDAQPFDRIFFNITRYNLEVRLHNVAKFAGLKRIRIHDLRHSHASMLVSLNVNPLAISKRLGHGNIQTTLNVYSHLYPNAAREVADKIDNVI